MSTDNKVNLNIVVNGTPTTVEANENSAVASVIEKALHQTGNAGQPPDAWQLNDPDGNPLGLELKVRDVAAFPKLYLSLRAGVAGAQ